MYIVSYMIRTKSTPEKYQFDTVEPVLKDRTIAPKIKCGLSRQVISGDRIRFSCIEMWDLQLRIHGPSMQVVSHGSGLNTGFTVIPKYQLFTKLLSQCYSPQALPVIDRIREKL